MRASSLLRTRVPNTTMYPGSEPWASPFSLGTGSIMPAYICVIGPTASCWSRPSTSLSWRPDGIHNNLLKYLPEDTLRILKEILNKIWISADFPQQWRAATVIPIPKPNKDHTDPLSYRPIALTSCLCKVLERMINTCLIWYLEKHRILDRSQCGFRKHRSTTDHLVSLERYLRDAFAQRQQAVGLFFDLEKAYETTWQYGIIRDLHRIGLERQIACFCVRISQGPANPSQNWNNTHWRILPRGRCSNWWCPGCDMFWTED